MKDFQYIGFCYKSSDNDTSYFIVYYVIYNLWEIVFHLVSSPFRTRKIFHQLLGLDFRLLFPISLFPPS